MWNNTISFYIFSNRVEKISLERSHKGKEQIFSFGFLQILFDYFLILRFFSVNKSLYLKKIKFGF
jgi:hypothetical protein